MSIVCLLTAKIEFDNTSTYEYSSYSPSARSLCSIACFGPIFKNLLETKTSIYAYNIMGSDSNSCILFSDYSEMVIWKEKLGLLHYNFMITCPIILCIMVTRAFISKMFICIIIS